MIGRVYIWRGAHWRIVARGEPFDRGPRRNVLLERVHLCRVPEGWALWAWRDRDGRLWWPVSERVVRPFRGLRRAVAP